MSVLDDIIVGVKEDLAARRLPDAQMNELLARAPKPLEALAAFRQSPLAVIAEVKRSSPSKGELAQIADPAALAKVYQGNGASAISVLTERRRFGGSLDDLQQVRKCVTIPLLRKDFMVDDYQFSEARAYGADLVLLIVAALSPTQLRDFLALTHELGMEALVEVHTEEELAIAVEARAELIGVNARNLKTLDVDSEVFERLLPLIPQSAIKIAESGISSRGDVEYAMRHGANGVLVGEALVRDRDPGMALRALLGRV